MMQFRDGPYCPRCEYLLVPGQRGPCLRCEEMVEEQKVMDAKWAISLGGQKAFEEYTFDKMVRTSINGAVIDRLKRFNPAKDNIYLTGPRGAGKSHLAGACKRKWVLSGVHCKTVFVDDALSEARAFIQNHKIQRDMIESFIVSPILSLEDMGVEKPTEFALNFLYQIINGRYLDKRAGLIVTSNESTMGLEDIWARTDPHGRIPSRLREMCVELSLVGEKDWRETKRPS